jgi:hypothetical protein
LYRAGSRNRVDSWIREFSERPKQSLLRFRDFPEGQKQLILRFRDFRDGQNSRFHVSGNSETAKTVDFAFPGIPEWPKRFF